MAVGISVKVEVRGRVAAVSRVETAEGQPLEVAVELAGRTVRVQIWQVRVGRVSLFLLDTNVPGNAPADQDVTDQLYGGDRETRIRQEIVLGIGGLRALKALGIEPAVCHMNEGHSAFLALERVRLLRQAHGLDFAAAAEVARAGNVFTTHTPVPAGFDVFEPALMRKYFAEYVAELGLEWDDFLALGEGESLGGEPGFNMAMLAVNLASRVNGVSQLHAAVTRKMWHAKWPDLPEAEVPVEPVTNGIHVGSWISHDMADLLDRYLGPLWREDPAADEAFARVDDIPDAELWNVRELRRRRLVTFARKRLQAQLERRGAPESKLDLAREVLRPDVLTIGFARRFATYKRASLLFHDLKRLIEIVDDTDRPVQFVFAGKAHPRDEPGKDFIREVYHRSHEAGLAGHLVFVEDYDMYVARQMVAGVDVWLNTPRRPMEASGTSGQKAGLNGSPNLSILDGWWAEGYNGKNGWAIGEAEAQYSSEEAQNHADASSLYDILEQEVIPTFYERDIKGIPYKWMKIVKESIRTVAPQFSMSRMVKEYTHKLYVPSME